MGNVFLASVGKAVAFHKVNGNYEHYFTAKTLTDSSINIGVSAEEIRGGFGGQLLGQFFHTSVFGLSLTDTMFNLEHVAAQVGSQVVDGGYDLTEEKLTAASGVIKLAGIPVPVAGTQAVAWYKKVGTNTIITKIFEEGAVEFEIEDLEEGDYCVSYFASKDNARKVIVKANFVPKEFMILLTTQLFAGDASAPETGKAIGSVTVKIYRFQLDGTMDLAMAMTSAATMALKGQALADDSGDCSEPKYAEIVEYIEGRDPFEGYTQLIADASFLEPDVNIPRIYAVGLSKVPRLVDNSVLDFSVPLIDGQWPNVRLETFTIKEGEKGAGLTGSTAINYVEE